MSTDTTYTITAVSDKTIEIPEDRLKEVSELTPLDEFFADRYGKKYVPATSPTENTITEEAESTSEYGVEMPF